MYSSPPLPAGAGSIWSRIEGVSAYQPDDRQVRGRLRQRGLLHKVAERDRVPFARRGDDPVLRDILLGHPLDRDDAAAGPFMGGDELRGARWPEDEVVREHEDEGLALQQLARAEDRVAGALRLILVDVMKAGEVRRAADERVERGVALRPDEGFNAPSA